MLSQANLVYGIKNIIFIYMSSFFYSIIFIPIAIDERLEWGKKDKKKKTSQFLKEKAEVGR